MQSKFKTILVVQSFPTLTHIINSLTEIPKPVLVIVLFNRDIYRFLKDLKFIGVSVMSIGSGTILRKSALSFLRTTYIKKTISLCKKFETENLILTFNNYSDMGALPVAYIKYKQLIIWVPYEEKRYKYQSHKDQKLLSYQNRISLLTNGLIEKRFYTGINTPGSGDCVGFNPDHKMLVQAKRKSLNQITEANKNISKIVSPNERFAVLVERELLKTRHISFKKFIMLMLELRKVFRKSNLELYVKFKPRHFTFTKYILFRVFGFKILPTRVPAQFYCSSNNCKVILGFTSSALSIDYGKPFICLATLEATFKKSMVGNIASMQERNISNKNNTIFIKKINEIQNVI